jgi:pyruvate dehydrogenase kinase 2/3/4
MKEFHLLPEPLVSQPSLKLVEKWYEESFVDIVEFENAPTDDEAVFKKFNAVLEVMRGRQQSVVETMARGVMEMKEQEGNYDDAQLDGRVQYFLDRFYMSRISIRMLMNQHLILFGDMENPVKHVGCIDPACDLLSVAEDAYENARFLCEQYYLIDAPKCNFSCHNHVDTPNKSGKELDRITMTYVPSHLYHMLFELFKNSLRAVVEFHKDASTTPDIHVLISKGREDVTIKLSDQGGGIRRSELDLLFNYMYSTAPRPPNTDSNQMTPLAGYGYGLPLSRLYAKYLHGDLWLNSVDGYGTDAMISLKLLPCDASEFLPVYNKTSTQKYTGSIQVGDWSDCP